MAIIDIKGVRIGEGIPKTVVSIMSGKGSQLVYDCGRVGEADCVEWRADAMADISSPDAYAGNCRFLSEELESQPLIFTCRTVGQGGMADLTATELTAILRAVIETGEPDLVDIELWLGDDTVRELVQLAHAHRVYAIVSYHDFAGTPETNEMTQLLYHMAELGADIPKLAVMAHCTDDAARLVNATMAASCELDTPLLTLAMGDEGSFTRVRGEVFGSALTFCAGPWQASAPGQVQLCEAVQAMAELHERLMQELDEA